MKCTNHPYSKNGRVKLLPAQEFQPPLCRRLSVHRLRPQRALNACCIDGLIVAPNIPTLLFNGSHSHRNLFQFSYDIQYTLVNSLKVLVVCLSSLPCQHNICLCVFLQSTSHPFRTSAPTTATLF